MIKNLFKKNNFAYWGILGSILLAVALFVPQIGYVGRYGEQYSMLNHFVSELGEIGTSYLAMVFNIGLIIGGICFIPFMLGLGRYFDNVLGKIGLIMGIFSAVCASLVGIFPMNNLIPHYIVAMLYFNGALVAIIVFTIAILIQKEVKIAKWTAIIGIVVIIVNAIALFSINPSDFSGFANGTIEEGFMVIFENRPDVWSLAILEWAMVLTVLGYMLFMALLVMVSSGNY